MKISLISLILGCLTLSLGAQDTLIFFENFDSSPGEKPPGWASELEVGDSKWQFLNGGGTKTPGIPGSRKPPTAYSDTVNALYFFESLTNESVILITPPINLEFALKPELRFMHVMREGNLGFGSSHDELRIYFKTHEDSAWTETNKLAEFTDEVFNWTAQTVLLPEEALVPECYLAFKATTKYGWGVGIDDVSVVETDVQPRVVDILEFFQSPTGILPTGSLNNPVMQVNVIVRGNSGTVNLNSLEVSSLNTADSDLETNGVKLHYNFNNQKFYESTLLGSSSFSSGKASFNSLGLSLPTGRTSLWISYDIDPDAVHGHMLDAMFFAGSIDIEGQTYPENDVSLEGESLIQEAVFLDDFATDRGWTLSGDFQRGAPQGLGGNFLGNPDPSFASGDDWIIGNDLSGLGALAGDYEPNVPRYGNLATSPGMDLFYYNDVKLNFLRWLNVANNDTASIEMSLDGGTTWKEVWSNDNNVFTDNVWNPVSLGIQGAHRQSQVQFRFNLGPTTLTDHLSGWNIENFSVTGNYIEYDVAPLTLVAPVTGCGLSAAETVTVRIGNLGPGATPDQIPLRYSFDGGETFSEDVIGAGIPFGGEVDFSFADKIDLSTPGTYPVVIETMLEVDEEDVNNLLDTVIYVDPLYALPYRQDFEQGNDFWRAEGVNVSLELGRPEAPKINRAASGTNAWVTNLDGIYSNLEDSYLTGPCFDFTGVNYPVFECQLFFHTQDDKDGARLEYSLDNGQTWSRVGDQGDGAAYDWNWYNSNAIEALTGGHGWSGGPIGWKTARVMLDPGVFRNQPSVKFRFHFSSDDSDRYEGMGIDDIRVFDAPRDLGVLSIDAPVDGCAQDIGDRVIVTIRNFGLDMLVAGDTIIVGYDLDSEPTVVDTFLLGSNLPSGSTLQYTFSNRLIITTSGTKYIEAFTLLEDDINFYNEPVTNDTVSKSFVVAETPIFFLPSEIYTVRPDTIVLDAYTGNPGDTYLWQDGSTLSYFEVTDLSDGIYHVTASNGLCDYRDTTYVYRLIADAGISELVDPVSSCELGTSVRPAVRVTNFGTDTLQVGSHIPVSYRVDAGPLVEETAVNVEMILPDSSFIYTFAAPADMSEVRSYTVYAFTDLAFDNDRDNDTLSVNVEVFGYTPIDLGNDTVVRALEYVIDAGAGYDTYLWSDGSDGQTMTVDTTGLYWVTVKQGTRCENADSILLTLLVPDIGIEKLYNPTDACGYSSTEHLEAYLLNTGSDTLQAGETVSVNYQFNGGGTVFDELVINRKVVPGDSILFSSAGTVDPSDPRTYDIVVEISYAKDLIPGNDMLNQTIEVYGYPEVSLGEDQVLNTKTCLLDPGAGYMTYLWQDGSTEQRYTVEYENQTPDTIYWVTVSDENGCEATDAVKISFDLWDVGISSILSPVSSCNLTDQEQLRIFVRNTGTHTILDERISLVASVDNNLPVTVQRRVQIPLDPGDSLEFPMGTTYDFSEKGDHTIAAYTIYEKDDDLHNDSVEAIIVHKGLPLPGLGGSNDSLAVYLPYTLDAGTGFVYYTWNGEAGSQTYEADHYGWYVLELIDPEGCYGIDSVYLYNPTGITELILPGELSVYPVPASRELYLEYTCMDAKTLTLEIFDAQGGMILVREYDPAFEITDKIDVTGFSKGIHILRLRSRDRQLIRHIVIN